MLRGGGGQFRNMSGYGDAASEGRGLHPDQIDQPGETRRRLLTGNEIPGGLSRSLKLGPDTAHIRVEHFRPDGRQVTPYGPGEGIPLALIDIVVQLRHILIVRAETHTTFQIRCGMNPQTDIVPHRHRVDEVVEFRRRGGAEVIPLAELQAVAGPVNVHSGQCGDPIGVEAGAVDDNARVKPVFAAASDRNLTTAPFSFVRIRKECISRRVSMMPVVGE